MTALLAAALLLLAEPSATALSVFQEPAPGRCVWMRIDPVQGRRELVAIFPHGCGGVSAAWSPDGTRAIVEFPAELLPDSEESALVDSARLDDSPRTRDAWIADVTALPARVERLELPERAGLLDVLAFDRDDGVPVALFLDVSPDVSRRNLVHHKRSYTVPAFLPGLPALAHAWRLESGRWQLVETVATTTEACGAPGTLRLEAAGNLARSTARLLDPAFGHDLSVEPIDVDLFETLESYERVDAESTYAWVRLRTDRGAVLAVEGGSEYAFLTTPVLLVDDDGIRELGGMPENAVLAAESRGRYLLLSEAVSGARPLLYDLEGGRLLFAASDSVAVTFWP